MEPELMDIVYEPPRKICRCESCEGQWCRRILMTWLGRCCGRSSNVTIDTLTSPEFKNVVDRGFEVMCHAAVTNNNIYKCEHYVKERQC